MFPSSRVDPVILGHLLSQHRDLHARILDLRSAFAPLEAPGAPAARGVVAEHPRLLAELDALLEHLPVRDIRPQEWSQSRARFTEFAEHLFAHERSEHAVVQQGYNEDFGIPE